MKDYSIHFVNKPIIKETYSIVGPKEGMGPIRDTFDYVIKDDKFGEESFEKAEKKMLFHSINGLINKSEIKEENVDLIISGDLLNQNISSNFMAREYGRPFLGVYSACSSFTEAVILGSTFIDNRSLNNIICATVSHFSTAERQYRYPLELGCTRPPQAQWTVTGAGSVLISKNKKGYPFVSSATIGRVVDFGVDDAFNMGAAMAPAACDTIIRHFSNMGTSPSDYDLIISGDLGTLGSRILKDLLWEKGFNVQNQHVDCGEIIYNLEETEYQGGSGAGCSSCVFAGYFFNYLKAKKLKRVLLVATGALLSSTSSQQGETIPAIAHAVEIGV